MMKLLLKYSVLVCSIAALFFILHFQQSQGVNNIEAFLLRDWAFNFTRNSGWNITLDPCFWPGFTCMLNGTTFTANYSAPGKGVPGDLLGIDINPSVMGKIIYGEFPDLDLWAAVKQANSGFMYLTWMTFQNFRFGPSFPDTILKYWTNYQNTTNPGQPFNVLFTSRPPLSLGNAAPSAICPLPTSFMDRMKSENKHNPGLQDVGCSNFYISFITPTYGPRSGGTNVTIIVNAPLGFLDIEVGFGVSDNETVPVPIFAHYLIDYPWSDGKLINKTIYSQMSLIRVSSPPHNPGPVEISIWAGSNRNAMSPPSFAQSNKSLTPHVLVTPRYNFGEDYKIIFNYECPSGTRQLIANNLLKCDPCPPGTWSPIFSSVCYNCSEGTYSSQSKSSSCTKCPKGTFGNRTTSTSILDCYSCQAGYYSDQEASTECKQCDPGYEQPSNGQTGCIQCTPGTYAIGTGNPNCTKCSPGSFAQVYGNSDGCNLCAIGFFSVLPGSSKCTSCPPGNTTKALGSTSCDKPCASGEYKSLISNKCVQCAPGRYSNSSSSTLCTLCKPGYYNPNIGSKSCSVCDPGSTSYQSGSAYCVKLKAKPVQTQQNDTGLIVGIILIVIALLLLIVAFIYIFFKKREQSRKNYEIEEIRKIMAGITK